MIPIPPFLASAAGKWLVIGVLVVAAALTGYLHGRKYERGVVAERDLKAASLSVKRLMEAIEIERELEAEVRAELAAARHSRDEYRHAFRAKLDEAPKEKLIEVYVPRETKVEVCDAGSGPSPERGDIPSVVLPAHVPIPRLSAIACGLWNDALAAGATAAERPGWLAGANPCTGTVEIEDAFLNLRENMALLGECRAREQSTQKWMRERGLTKKGGE